MTHDPGTTNIVIPSAARDLYWSGKALRFAQGDNLLSFGRAK